MPWIPQHYIFTRVGSFKVDLQKDLPDFLIESENPDDITYPSAPISFWVTGGVPNFPTVNLGYVDRYNFGHFYAVSPSNTVRGYEPILYLRSDINSGRAFDFRNSASAGTLSQVRYFIFDSNYPLLETYTYILKTVFVPD